MSRRALLASLALVWLPARLSFAQVDVTSTAIEKNRAAVETTIDAATLDSLPSNDTIFSILETTQPSIISDRFTDGGLYTGEAPRLSSFFSSWSQTVFRVGDVDVSDPTGRGGPLVLPDFGLWDHVDVSIGSMSPDLNAAGLAITLEPLRPTSTWKRSIVGLAGPSGPEPSSGPPPISRLRRWDRGSAVARGPLVSDETGTPRITGLFSGSWTASSRFDRSQPIAADSSYGSAFAELLFTPRSGSEVRTIGWVEKSTSPLEDRLPLLQAAATAEDSAAHMQVSWSRPASPLQPRAFAGYTQRRRNLNLLTPVFGVFEQLIDNPVTQIETLAPDIVREWSAGYRIGRPTPVSGSAHALEGGIDFGGARATASSFVTGSIGELVDGNAARVWQIRAPALTSVHSDTTFDAFVNDHITLGARATAELGLRFDSVSGSARDASTGIGWHSFLPRARVASPLFNAGHTSGFAGYSRSAYRLPLDLLAFGDPAAPTADVYQWLSSSTLSATGALVARVGPGTGGDPLFSGIDPNLRRPYTDELVIGIESHPAAAFRLSLVGFARWESNLLGLTNSGIGSSAYSIVSIPNPERRPIDVDTLTIYNRTPASFGQDRYVLTNPSEDRATSQSIVLSAEVNTPRVLFAFEAAANQTDAPAANRGFGPLQNDHDLVGELFVDPNATSFSRGRLYDDRAYTLKITSVCRLPADVRVGVAARYQDGQPFARMIVVPGLNQGTEAVRAFPNGDSRFTFTETVDARVQKGFSVGTNRVDVIFDVFNLLNTANEVEEETAAGPTYRIPTAMQPPRSFHVGLRLSF